ncbi:hypothetical protein AB0945_33175, partial [Streptomyces sp. NPDC005474]
MAWRDRLRRRAAADRSGVPGDGPSGAGPDRGAPDGPSPSASGAPGSSLPVDWDGGWRRTAAPELTVSRAPLGVSDGLAFRAGLAAWQNPSFDAGLGHALLPTAPTGLVRGVTRPATPQPTHTGGGPLLLRALRPEGPAGLDEAHGSGNGGSGAGTPDGPMVTRPTRAASRTVPGERRPGSAPSSGSGASAVRPSGSGSGTGGGSGAGVNSTAGDGSSGENARTRGLTSTDSPAVLSSSPAAVQRAVAPADTGHQQVVPRPPLVRRVAVVPPPAAQGTVARPTSDPNSGRASGSSAVSGSRTPARHQVVQRSAKETTATRPARGDGEQPGASRTSGAEASPPAVRLGPSGPRLTAARRPAGPVRRVAAVRPANPPVSGTAPTHEAAGTTTPAGTGTGSTAPVQRTAAPARSRTPLGAPLSELPSTATPLTQNTPASGAVSASVSASASASGPTLPVVQRQADTPGPNDSGTGGTGSTGST